MPVPLIIQNYVCYRNNQSESEILWKEEQKDAKLKNVLEFQVEDEEEEEKCYQNLRSFVNIFVSC